MGSVPVCMTRSDDADDGKPWCMTTPWGEGGGTIIPRNLLLPRYQDLGGK